MSRKREKSMHSDDEAALFIAESKHENQMDGRKNACACAASEWLYRSTTWCWCRITFRDNDPPFRFLSSDQFLSAPPSRTEETFSHRWALAVCVIMSKRSTEGLRRVRHSFVEKIRRAETEFTFPWLMSIRFVLVFLQTCVRFFAGEIPLTSLRNLIYEKQIEGLQDDWDVLFQFHSIKKRRRRKNDEEKYSESLDNGRCLSTRWIVVSVE